MSNQFQFLSMIPVSSQGFIFFKNHTLRFPKTEENLLSFYLLVYILISFECFQIGTKFVQMLQVTEETKLGKL